jgi:hypothetical protein
MSNKNLALFSVLMVGFLIAGYYAGLVMYFVAEMIPHYPPDGADLLDPPMTGGESMFWKSTMRDMGILGITPAIGLHLYFVWLSEVLLGDSLDALKCKIVKLSVRVKSCQKIYKAQDSMHYRKGKRA